MNNMEFEYIPLEFRAWDGEEMHYGVWVNDIGECFVRDKETDRDMLVGDYAPPYNSKYVPKVHVMQFSGELDSNGVKIYNGDICKCIAICADEDFPEMKAAEPEIHTVKQIGGSFLLGYGFFAYEKIEVIGNIYENRQPKTTGNAA